MMVQGPPCLTHVCYLPILTQSAVDHSHRLVIWDCILVNANVMEGGMGLETCRNVEQGQDSTDGLRYPVAVLP